MKFGDTEISDETAREAAVALEMRANYIETHNVALSRNDAVAQRTPGIIRHVDDEQAELVRKLRAVAAILKRQYAENLEAWDRSVQIR